MKRFFCAVALVCCLSSVASAELLIGTSLADAQSGNDLNLILGAETELEIWATGPVDTNIRGMSFNLNSDVAGLVNSTALTIDSLSDRWPVNNLGPDRLAGSASGLLIDDQQLATIGGFLGTGITFTATDPFIRLGTVTLSADAIGAGTLTFSDGSNTAIDSDLNELPGFADGLRGFTVSAVPEPGSFAILGLAGVACGYRRYRRNKSAAKA